ncbi:hypothetical protein D3C75_1106140 [compost metagenome]
MAKRLRSTDFSSSTFRKEASNSRFLAISCGAETAISALTLATKKVDIIAMASGDNWLRRPYCKYLDIDIPSRTDS